MAALYVKEQGAVIQKVGKRIIVSKNGTTLLEQPIINLTNISIIGNVQVTTQALHLLLENGVDISFFSYNGSYLGYAGAEASKNVFLRLEQYRAYMNEAFRLEMAKCIVSNKIDNQIALIKAHRWNTEAGEEWKKELEQMEIAKSSLAEKTTANQVLGVEGISSNLYFRAFGRMIKGDFQFLNRNRRPPKDPVNIILSLAYTFLTKEICNALESESFEPYLGFLHGVRYGRKSLALDIIEEFRQPVVDRLVLILFGKRMLNRYDFEVDDDGSIRLNEDGFRKFCREYERWMTEKNSLAGDHFRRRIIEQIALLKKSFVSEAIYSPYKWEERDVSGEL